MINIFNNIQLQNYVDNIWQDIDGQSGTNGICRDQIKVIIHIEPALMENSQLYKLQIIVSPESPVTLSGLRAVIKIPDDFKCTYKPHLTPLDNMVIGEKVFRGAPIVMESDEQICALIPEFDEIKTEHVMPFMMDYVLDGNLLFYGVANQVETGHVYYRLTDQKSLIDKEFTFSFYVAVLQKRKGVYRDYRAVNDLIWHLIGRKEMVELKPAVDPNDLKVYTDYVYNWAFNSWRDICWQEFKLGSQTVAGVVFIVTARQKPGMGKEDVWREPKSIWNQAWFSSLRSAYGYYNWGKIKNNQILTHKARKVLDFALASPQEKGLFCTYYQASPKNDFLHGKWVSSPPRRPDNHEGYYHLLDSSWTCYWMLKWYLEIEPVDMILTYVRAYVDTLLSLERPDGSYPAWVESGTFQESPYLQRSPESAMHMLLYCKLYEINGDERLLQAAKRTAEFLREDILSTGKWEDFETYWSCSGTWEEKKYGLIDKRSGLYNQCSFGMYWCAEAYLALYKASHEVEYLETGEKVLAEASFYQQLYRPYGFPVETLGGFGVMNCDDEWNDSRQSLFALTFLRYYAETGNEMYRHKALWSMRASFYMMYCPENPEVKELYEKVYPYFDENDYGFHMENFNHHDGTPSVMGLGEFTIFDWSNGAACSSLYEFIKIYDGIAEDKKYNDIKVTWK